MRRNFIIHREEMLYTHILCAPSVSDYCDIIAKLTTCITIFEAIIYRSFTFIRFFCDKSVPGILKYVFKSREQKLIMNQ